MRCTVRALDDAKSEFNNYKMANDAIINYGNFIDKDFIRFYFEFTLLISGRYFTIPKMFSNSIMNSTKNYVKHKSFYVFSQLNDLRGLLYYTFTINATMITPDSS